MSEERMRKKMFCPKASVVKGRKWQIDFTIRNPLSGADYRRRNEFGLNQIDDLELREATATAICNFLRDFDFEVPEYHAGQRDQKTVESAIREVLDNKKPSDRRNTRKTYASVPKIFMEWARSKGLHNALISDFGLKEANMYLRYRRDLGKKARTVNNDRAVLRLIWNEYNRIATADVKNPWRLTTKDRPTDKNRRIFSEDERFIVASYIAENHYWLFRGVLLQYYCFIRPVEISRLRFKSFDFGAGIVKIEWWEAKSKKTGYVTIPKSIHHYFLDGVFDKQPGNFYLFGKRKNGLWPGPKPLRDDVAYKVHREVLIKLHKLGKLMDITGLTYYSWKDLGISTFMRITNPLSTRDQARHTDLNTTLMYYHEPKVNAEYASLPDHLLRPLEKPDDPTIT